MSDSQTRIDGLAFERQDTEDALVDLSQRLMADETIQSLKPQSELGKGEGTLPSEAAAAQPSQVFARRCIPVRR